MSKRKITKKSPSRRPGMYEKAGTTGQKKARVPKAGATKTPGLMNKTEEWYAYQVLQPKLQSGEILKWMYEAITLRLAKSLTYTPDFYVVTKDGTVELHETKGSWTARGQQTSRAKIKMASELYPEFDIRVLMIKNRVIVSEERL